MHAMRLWHGTCLALVLMILAGCGASAVTGPILSVDRLAHEFPPASDWKPATEFVVTNGGGAPLKIDRIESSCGCATANAGRSELAAREKTTLRVQVARPAIGYQNATVKIFSDADPDRPLILELKCWANSNEPRIIAYGPREILLRNLDGDKAPEVEIVALERAGERLVRSAECDLPFVAVVEMQSEATPTTSPEYFQRKYRFVAALMDEHPFGRFGGKLTFQLERQHEDKGPRQFGLPIQIVAVPPLYADPDVLFGTLSESGGALQWRVRIRRRSDAVKGKPLMAMSNAEWLSVELQDAPGEPGGSDVRDPRSAGILHVRVGNAPGSNPGRAEVTVKGDDLDLPEIKIPVVVTRGGGLVAGKFDE